MTKSAGCNGCCGQCNEKANDALIEELTLDSQDSQDSLVFYSFEASPACPDPVVESTNDCSGNCANCSCEK